MEKNFMRLWLGMICAVIAGMIGGCSSSDGMRVVATKCEYLAEVRGIDVEKPRLSWELEAGGHGRGQSAYRVLAASSEELLAKNAGDLWDTGKVQSNQSIQVEYAGKELASRQEVWWKVRVWDEKGEESGWSVPERWSMGLLKEKDWGEAKWIGLDENEDGVSLRDFRAAKWIWYSEGEPAKGAPVGIRYLRKTFELPAGKVKRAEMFLAADDAAMVRVNGKNVGEEQGNANLLHLELSPGDLREGKNRVELEARNLPAPVALNPAGVAGSLRVEFEDATRPAVVIVTDGGWEAQKEKGAEWSGVKVMGGIGMAPWGDPYGEVWRPEHRRLAGRMLRREFEAGKVVKATATVCGLGYFDFYLNGRKVSDHWMDPGLTEYTKRCLYVTFDVTDQVKEGKNAMGVQLGNGRFYAPRRETPVHTTTFGYPKLRMNLHLEYGDGRSEDVVSDPAWKVTDQGPVRANNEYDGEEYDARQEQDGWDQIGFDDSGWENVELVKAPGGVMEAQKIEPVRVTGIMKPVAITELKPGVFVVDFGQSFYGVTRLHVKGQAGTKVEMRSSFAVRPDGMLKTENDRSALNTDVYVLKGSGKAEVWCPEFKGTATRRVQITGYPGKPTRDDFEGLVLGTDFATAGNFACSNELINKIFSNARWGTRMQNRSIPMEPDRDERQGWSGHPAKTSESEGWNFEVAPFYANWLKGVGMEQHGDGSLQEISPGYWTFSSNGTIWPAIVTIIPDWMYNFYDDRRVLAENYQVMKKWVMYHVKVNQRADFTTDHHSYDDWVDATRIGIQDLPASAAGTMPMISTAYHYNNCKILARAAGILGNAEDQKTFSQLAEKIKAGFNARFFDEKAEKYGDGRQFAYVLPLAFGMVPPEHREGVIRNLVDQIMVKDAGHTSVGLLGTQWEMQVLTDIGHPEVAYTIATQTTRPSWGYMIAHGATTIWERWDTDTQGGGMNGESQKILSGNFEAWCYQTLAGINYDPEHPGFKHLILRPRPVGDLTWVKGAHHSMYGEIRSEWKIDAAGNLHWEATVPVNTTATAYVPVMPGGKVKVNGDAAKFVKTETGDVVYELGSGTYSFESTHFHIR